MRAPGSSVSGWHETSGCAIVKRMSAKRPRSRRSRMCRSVSSYGSAGAAPTASRPSSSASRLSSAAGHAQDCAREGDPHPRGRRAGGAPLRGRARPRRRRRARCSSSCARRRSTISTSGCARVCPPCRSRASSAPTAPARRGARRGVDGFEPGERVVINPGLEHGARITVIGEHTDGTHAELIAVPGDERLPARRRDLVRGGGRVPARLRDRVPDARHAGAAAARASGCSSGGSAAASRRRRSRSRRRSARA